jgi:hypothetical protein
VLGVVLCLASCAVGQEDPARQKAIREMRRVADAMKQCSEQRSKSYQDDCEVWYFLTGPPANLEWDVLPSKTARSPFQGIVEFTLPSHKQDLDPPNQSKKAHDSCYERKMLIDQMAVEVWSKQGSTTPPPHHYHHRYEFDLGSDEPELVKMLLVDDETKQTSAANDQENDCWVQAARAIKPWNKTAIRTEFVELTTSEKKGTINIWYALTNTTDLDYRIESLDQVTTAARADGDSLYAFNQGLSLEVPLLIPAHRTIRAILHAPLLTDISVADNASGTAVSSYKIEVMNLLGTKYAKMRGFAIMDGRTRYEIDFDSPR